MKHIQKLRKLLLTLAMVIGLMPGMSLTAQAASTELTEETTTWENGDYVVPADGVTIGHITVSGTVNLTLTEGATLTANAGITLSDGATLNVSGKGTMAVNGSNNNTSSTVAGTGMLVLNGGTLTAKGGNGQSFSSEFMNNKTGNTGGVAINGTVIVSGGTLAATGGDGGSINGDTLSKNNGGAGSAAISGAVTINSGTLAATGGNGGSVTITSFGDNNKGGNGGAAIGGAVTINGGTLTATKGNNGTLTQSGGYGNSGGAGGAGYDGTLTLGAGVKLYEGTDNTGTVLDGNDSASRVYEGEKKASMYAQGLDKTALNNAITVAETLYNSIKDVADYSEIAATLSTAIDAAKDVAESDTADQNAVDAATTAITTAKTNAEAAKKDVDDTTEANKVSDLIEDLPAKEAITKADKTKVDAARAAYDALTDNQKAKISDTVKNKLETAETAVVAAEQPVTVAAKADPYNTGAYYATFYDSTTSYTADCEVYYATANADGRLTLQKAEDNVIKAGEGVILKATSETVTLMPTTTEASYDSLLTGSDSETTVENALVLSLGKNGVWFYKYSGTLGANKAYLAQ